MWINPLMELASAKRIASLPSDAKAALDELLSELGDHADRLAEQSWRRRKGSMAAYWRAVAVYARHTRRLCRMEHKMCRCGDWFVGLPSQADCNLCSTWDRIGATPVNRNEP